eukprot:879612-Rhodomonas_salina.1
MWRKIAKRAAAVAPPPARRACKIKRGQRVSCLLSCLVIVLVFLRLRDGRFFFLFALCRREDGRTWKIGCVKESDGW